MPVMSNHRHVRTAAQLSLTLLATAFLAGCASYDFRIIRPQEHQKFITDSPAHIQTANMSYQMQAREARLVVMIYNEKDQVVQLLGNQSFVVDPAGASHPLRTVTIAPHSYTKLILPPLRPRFEDAPPQWNFGVSGDVSDARPATDQPTQPVYLDYYEDIDAFYWDWDGQKPIRLSITYRFADGQQATDEFTIEKVKR